MLGSLIILGLSTCAFALNARYEEGNSNTNGGYESKSLGASTIVYTPKPSKPTAVHSGSSHTPFPSGHLSCATHPPGYGHSASGIPYPTGTKNTSVQPGPTGTPNCAPYWLENIKHQGLASFNPDPDSYQVFRNVMDYGAKGEQKPM